MRRTIMSAAALVATLLLPLAAHTPLAQGNAPAIAAGPAYARVIVKYRADSDLMKKQAMTATGKRILQAQALGDRIGVALTAGIGLSDRSHVVMARGLSSSSLAARIAAQRDIEYAVVDGRKHIVAVPNDSFYASRATTANSGGPAVGQWYLKPPGLDGTAANTAPASINAEQAWDVLAGNTNVVVVAVLDTGLRFDHPDLPGNVLPGYDMVSAENPPTNTDFSTAADNNGRDADASDPGDSLTAAEISGNPDFTNCTPSNSSWHGTQTLGLIAALTNNSKGIASVGRGFVRPMPVRVLGKCGGSDSDIQAAILWAAGIHVPGVPDNANPAKVINMSLGGTGTCNSAYIDVISQANAAGAVIVVSAGNSAGHLVGTPANCPGVIAVTGLRHVGDKVGFSDLGPEVTISAPGGNCVNVTTGSPCLYPIMTTANSGTTTPVAGAAGAIYTDSFNPSLGTSFSAPLVSGTVALMFAAKPSMTPVQVKATLQASARAFPTTGGSPLTPVCTAPTAVSPDQNECYCTVGVCGAGMLDAHAALLAAVGVQAGISVTTATPTAGQPISIASSSVIGAGQSATYQWMIVSAGTTGAAITGASNASTVTVSPTAAGVFTISLTTTDNNGFVSTASSVITVVAAQPPVQAAITVTTAAPTAGQPVAIASSSVIGAGQSAAFQWAIVSAGSTGAVITGASNASTVTVSPSAAGSFTISLTTTDNRGFVSSVSSTVTVAAAASSGGGGAIGGGWLMLLLTAVLALAAVSRFERRRRAARPLSAPARVWRRR